MKSMTRNLAEDRNGKETQYCTLLVKLTDDVKFSIQIQPTPSIQRLTVYEMGCNVNGLENLKGTLSNLKILRKCLKM